VEFLPPLDEAKEILIGCLKEIVNGTSGLNRVEAQLFPDLREHWQRDQNGGRNSRRSLFSVCWEEDRVQELCKEAILIFESNLIGPRKYIKLYNEYTELLNGNAEKERDQFLQETEVANLSAFVDQMNVYDRLRREIRCIRGRATLNLFLLDCRELNSSMEGLCGRLHQSLIGHQVGQKIGNMSHYKI